jgi:hypothetical protein
MKSFKYFKLGLRPKTPKTKTPGASPQTPLEEQSCVLLATDQQSFSSRSSKPPICWASDLCSFSNEKYVFLETHTSLNIAKNFSTSCVEIQKSDPDQLTSNQLKMHRKIDAFLLFNISQHGIPVHNLTKNIFALTNKTNWRTHANECTSEP